MSDYYQRASRFDEQLYGPWPGADDPEERDRRHARIGMLMQFQLMLDQGKLAEPSPVAGEEGGESDG